MKTYKCVPGPTQLSAAKNGSEDAVKSFANIINREATDGWEYHSMETISVVEPAGCLQLQPVPVNYYMLIFERNDR